MSRKSKNRSKQKAPPVAALYERRWIALALAICLIALAGGAGFYVWQRATTPKVPVFKMEGADPAVARVVEEARAAVVQSPRSGQAWGRLGMVLSIHDFLTESEFCFAAAERFTPLDPRWPYFRGLARSDDSPEFALPCLQRAARLCTNAGPQLRLAEMLSERGKLDEAEALIRPVLQRDPNDARALLGLGRLALARGQLKESLGYLQRSISSMSDIKATYALLATVRQRMGDLPGADEAQRKAAQLPEQAIWVDPFLLEINKLRTGLGATIDAAQVYQRQGQARLAVPLMEKAVRDYPDKPRAWLVLAKTLNDATNFPAAERAARQAVLLDPKSIEPRVELGSAMFGQGRYAEAEINYVEATRMRPNLAEGWFDMGLCRMNLQNYEGAIEAFRSAVRSKPDLAMAYVRWGQSLGRLGQFKEAVEQVEHGLKLAPGNPEATRMIEGLRQNAAIAATNQPAGPVAPAK